MLFREMAMREKDENFVSIWGSEHDIEDGTATYHGLEGIVPFTGRIRPAKDFIDEHYVQMAFQKATAFKTVLDMTLKEGSVLEAKDRS